MNSNVHPLVAALVLALTALAIAIWMWGSGAAANIGGPSELRKNASGHAFIQIQNQLIEHDAHGAFVKTHDLGALGVDVFLGSYAFFSNGDILLRRGPDPRSFTDNVRSFQRKTNANSIDPDSPESGLFRCTLDSLTCKRFAPVDFKAAHGVFIDWRTDDVYISDTTRHVLRKYTEEGDQVAGPIDGFEFPNQLHVYDGKLYVADTNHHEIRIVSPDTNSFGQDLGRQDVSPPRAAEARQVWPSHFTRVGDRWWVNNMRTGMNEGGIYVFDESWQLQDRLELPSDADPIALIALRDEIWISDWNSDAVRRFSQAGEPLANLESAGLDAVLITSSHKRRNYELAGYSGILLFAFVLGGLGVRAVVVAANEPSTRVSTTTESQVTEVPFHLVPDDKALRKIDLTLKLVTALFVVMIGIGAYVIGTSTTPEIGLRFLWPTSAVVALFGIVIWVNHANSGTAISVQGDQVTLRDHTGRESTSPINAIRYDETAIADESVVVFLGRPTMSIYARKQLEETLFPRLIDAEKVSILTMQKILIQLRHPQGTMLVITGLGLLVYAVWTFVR